MVSFSHSTADVPAVETERLILRGPRLTDLAASAAMWADPIVTRYISGRAFTEEEVWHRLLRYAGLWSWLRFGYWVVEEKATGAYAGELGFADFHREMEPPIHGLPELGWVLASHAHGKGYATEAVHAALAWGHGHVHCGRTVCLIHPENRASLRVAAKCGFEEQLRTEYKGQPVILFARPL